MWTEEGEKGTNRAQEEKHREWTGEDFVSKRSKDKRFAGGVRPQENLKANCPGE